MRGRDLTEAVHAHEVVDFARVVLYGVADAAGGHGTAPEFRRFSLLFLFFVTVQTPLSLPFSRALS
jgi:hypothetical protein